VSAELLGGAAALTPGQRLARQIEAGGPISVAHVMAEANAHYYGSRDPLGAAGDFITAPEISQMFGELVGLCLADAWMRSGRRPDPLPDPFYVELGPGRGTLAADALRAMAMAALAPRVHLVETSPTLRERQRALLPHAAHHDDLDSVPEQGALLIVANEFFDALPVRQIARTEAGWRERVVVSAPDAEPGTRFVPMAGYRAMDAAVPAHLAGAPVGSIIETSPACATIAFTIARRLMKQGGVALFIDYGYEGPAVGDTLQAVRGHKFSDPFAHVGESDLTAHVDFGTIGNIGRQAGLTVLGPVDQGAFLTRLGIDARAAGLAKAQPERAAEVEAARNRLVAPDQMGTLFKVMAFVHPAWMPPEGFA
jgi:NADH dehydrogenase [ubiquinone] 1 alpha subcomplex assembly factor 7